MKTKEEILKILEGYKQQADYLMNLISNKNISLSKKKSEISEKAKSIKEALKSEYKRLHLKEARNALNKYERGFYSPAITDAYIHFTAKYNTNDLDNLFSSIYDVHDYMNYWIRMLESYETA